LFLFVGREGVVWQDPTFDTEEGGNSGLFNMRELFLEFLCEMEADDG